MKLWQKIFVCFVLLFLTIFNIGIYLVLENCHKLSLEREVRSSLIEEYAVLESIKSAIASIDITLDNNEYLSGIDKRIFVESYIYDILDNHTKLSHYNYYYIELLDEFDNIIFSNFKYDIDGKREELKRATLNERAYVARNINENLYIFTTHLLKIDGQTYKFTYIKDISFMSVQKKRMFDFIIKLQIIIFIIIAILTLFISKYITKPLYKLIESIKVIKEGDYSKRVQINTDDEIGILANDFNDMASVVEENIMQLNDNLEKKQRFIDNFTHELKTPLTSIIGYSDFMLNTKYDEQNYLLALNYISSEGKRLKLLSEKMMNLVKVNKSNFNFKQINLSELLYEIKDILKARLKQKNIKLKINAKDYKAFVEKDLIKNMIINFIDNAIKASNFEGIIELFLYKKDEELILEIKDYGKGIAKDELQRIFEPFYMVDKSRTKRNDDLGLGLGLSICSEIAQLHDIKIDIDSEIKMGTTVKIIFNT
ncbi:MAG: HAMP domain-containing histidine kinase [Peptostreptococcaceae bacterium]|jgi:signal transduction histidine kinase|nr:HAMP domain-containing histidine kinase [Peptostreptococcaceae bacterium]